MRKGILGRKPGVGLTRRKIRLKRRHLGVRRHGLSRKQIQVAETSAGLVTRRGGDQVETLSKRGILDQGRGEGKCFRVTQIKKKGGIRKIKNEHERIRASLLMKRREKGEWDPEVPLGKGEGEKRRSEPGQLVLGIQVSLT